MSSPLPHLFATPDVKIRVLRIVSRMNTGGPAIQITGLMRNLSSAKFDQLLLAGQCDNSEIDYLKENGITLRMKEIPHLGRRVDLLSDFRALLQIRREIRAFRPDVVHTHTAKAGFIGRIAAISVSRRIKLVHTFHGHLLTGYFGRAKTTFVLIIEKILALFSECLIAVGTKVKQDLIRRGVGDEKKFSVVGPGITLGPIPQREDACKSLDLDPNVFRISWIGRVVPVKAPMRVLELAEAALRLQMRAEFTIVGDGPLMAEMRERAGRNSSNIRFLGWQNEIERVLAASDLVILTSLNEGTPVALIQAQIAGIPVVATDVGSTREVMRPGETGFCLPFSVKEFMNCINALYSNQKLRHEFGFSAQKFAQAKFSLNSMVDAHSKIYKNLN